MTKRRVATLTLVAVLPLLAIDVMAQVRAEYDRGASALSRQLQRLQTTASVLHTGAHPDDEDSALVAYHARHDHARTAYLSLTRGSGGQNIIGSEQADLLGVIRTEELLQARRLDGAQQLFTRANDFGFSKQRDEGARLWDEQAVLGDMVRAIRRFRPTVVVSRWNGTPSDGHGHHQFAGYLAPLAVYAAADPARYPEQIEEGLLPWQASKFYVGERLADDPIAAGLLVTDTGRLDPVSGRSYFQIGMRGRSQQKTQQMGTLELHGEQSSGLRLVESRIDAPHRESGIFDGIDTRISAISDFEEQLSSELAVSLRELERLAAGALKAYQPLQPALLVAPLSEGLATARSARRLARSADAQRLLDEKIEEFQAALVMAAGITVDALSDRETVVPGSDLQVAIRVYQLDGSVATLSDAALEMPAGWHSASADLEYLSNEQRARRRERPDAQYSFIVGVPAVAVPTEPYWLARPRARFDYDWSQAGEVRTEPFAPPLLMATVDLEIGGQPVSVTREVQHRYVDRIRGEIRRRLDVVPAVSVEPTTRLKIIALSARSGTHEMLLTVRNHSTSSVSGETALVIPDGWTVVPSSQSFSLLAQPATTTLSFEVTIPDRVAAGGYRLKAVADVDGMAFDQAMRVISYPHIQTHRVYEDAVTDFEIIDVDVAPVHIGYVMGSGDQVPDALRLMGLDVTLLDDDALTSGDLAQFDTIVIGIRASQTRPAYVANNQRLLDFVRAGGTMIVQYQQPDFAAQGLAPYPVSMDGSVRVVDETAAVTILEPAHPVFNFPNRIGPADFEDWVQERNNYNITDFDRDRYLPLTESHDPGDPRSDGAMLYARIGDGHYVYTSYSWFRQLPNGTPGGYRIFANLLSLPAVPD